jgi:hypothetical protein
MDRNLKQRDIAKAWDVNDAVVSRFIRTGEPEMTLARVNSLAKVFKMDVNEVMARLEDVAKPVPARQANSHARRPTAPAASGSVSAEDGDPLANLYAAIAMIKARMPGLKVTVTITSSEDGGG